MEQRPDVIMSVMKLSRAMRRGAPHHPHGGPGHGHMMGGGRVLELIAEQPGLSPGDLSEKLDMRPSSVSEAIDRLEKEELVTRSADANDKRVTRIELTERGKEKAAEHAEKRSELTAKLTACFTDEEAARFVELCGKLTDHLNALNDERKCDGEERHHCHHRHMPPHFRPDFGFPPPPPEDEDRW